MPSLDQDFPQFADIVVRMDGDTASVIDILELLLEKRDSATRAWRVLKTSTEPVFVLLTLPIKDAKVGGKGRMTPMGTCDAIVDLLPLVSGKRAAEKRTAVTQYVYRLFGRDKVMAAPSRRAPPPPKERPQPPQRHTTKESELQALYRRVDELEARLAELEF